MFRERFAVAVLLACGALVGMSCLDATAVRVQAYTDVPWGQGRDLAIFTETGETTFTDPSVESSQPWPSTNLGDVVLVPSGDKSARVRVQLTVGVTRPASQCSIASPGGCIFVRRRLGFVDHKTLTVPMIAYASCIGVPCDEKSTCSVLGQCVPADVDPSTCEGSGCLLPGESVPNTLLAEGPDGGFLTPDGGIVGLVTPDGGTPPPPPGGGSGALQTHGLVGCFKTTTGQVKCWGANFNGQLGVGDIQDRGTDPSQMGAALPFVNLGTGRTVKQLSVGGNFSCAILDDDRVKCWGQLVTGTIGDSASEMGDALPYIDLGTGRTARSISCGGSHTCAVLDNATVRCWGQNFAGQLGVGDTTLRGENATTSGDAIPVVDFGTAGAPVRVFAGFNHSCALFVDETLRCWGDNNSGELGLGTTQNHGDGVGAMGNGLPAIDFGAGRKVRDVSLGNEFGCVLLDNGAMKCWGGNGFGQLGLGDTTNRGDVAGQMGDALPNVSLGSLVVGGITTQSRQACAVLKVGGVKCWGQNLSGELGYGDTKTRGTLLADMGDSLPFVDLGTGRTATELSGFCALLDNAAIKCWGLNGNGQLGIGTIVNKGDNPGEMGDALPSVDLGIP